MAAENKKWEWESKGMNSILTPSGALTSKPRKGVVNIIGLENERMSWSHSASPIRVTTELRPYERRVERRWRVYPL